MGQTNFLALQFISDAILSLLDAQDADEKGIQTEVDRHCRNAIFSSFAYFEAAINESVPTALGFDHINSERKDVLEEFVTDVDNGKAVRKRRYYRTEDRFCVLATVLTGGHIKKGGTLWQDFTKAKKIRDKLTHPRPPYTFPVTSIEEAMLVCLTVNNMFAALTDTGVPISLPHIGTIASAVRKFANEEELQAEFGRVANAMREMRQRFDFPAREDLVDMTRPADQ